MTEATALLIVCLGLLVFVFVLIIMLMNARDKIDEQNTMLEEQSQRIDRLIRRGWDVRAHSERMAKLLEVADTQLRMTVRGDVAAADVATLRDGCGDG